ncbi:Polyketide cyclase / dehydrase and lipid transport [Actinacidiphila yanglinensis]|uniref:Polyketide cyclase / dehydrase and lipid transport n=1 Tax=Actinacidiphila yanglinensis TaxID=310779 RepID=A0A1H6A265_9ACTN|nr:SRPBCC family protein [Actinacidiphila yanglinensis]SEG42442.1 Polyketide cyclase / dehydrase and lipid transport [Actinacidiphila yanglinensis]
MSTIEDYVDVRVPVRTAYNQWTQFESFPRFMHGVVRVERSQATLIHWVTRHGGVTREFDAEVVEQRPDERIAWRSLDSPTHSGEVRFHPRGEGETRVTLRLEFSPAGLVDWAGASSGVLRRRVHGNLECFKQFIEGHGRETGEWRGEITESRVRPDSGQECPRVPSWPSG